MRSEAISQCGASRAGGTTAASTGATSPTSAGESRRRERTSSGHAHPLAPASGRARLVHGADAGQRAAEADPAGESRALAPRRDPRAALPRARAGRPLPLPAGDGARRRARPRERRDVHRGHRRRQPRCDLRPRHAGARLRGAHGLPVLLLRHGGVRPGEPRRARRAVERPARRGSVEHEDPDPLGTRRGLITGAGGQLGHALGEAFPNALPLTRAEWDVTFPPPPGLEADFVLHAAAWTNVDAAEDDPQSAAAVNVGGTQHAASLGVPLVTWSTDYVFDGTKRTPYVESDAPFPLGAYGRTKLHGEAAAGDRAWVVRTSWLFGPTSHNFVRTMLRIGAERDEVAVVDDQRGSPTYVGHLAEATRAVMSLPFGVYHVAAGGECTWAEFAEAIFEDAGLPTRVRRITTAEFGARAPRPAYSVLRSEKGAPELPTWREGLRACLTRLDVAEP